MNNNEVAFVRKWAEDDRSAGHPVEDYNEFCAYCKDEGISPSEALYDIYVEALSTF